MDSMVFVHMARALNPLQVVRVQFAKGLDGIRMLSVLNGLGVIQERALAFAIIASQDWAHTGRVLNVKMFPHLADVQGIPALAERGIESIDSGRESPLNALQTSREKKRQEAYHEIVNAVAPRELCGEIESYGLVLRRIAEKEINYFHSIRFAIRNGDEDEEILSLEGWSGNILNGHRKAILFCFTLDTAREQLKLAYEQYLERVTATA